MKLPQIIAFIPTQRLWWWAENGQLGGVYPISTAQAGEQRNSFCTPRGLHVVRAVIGRGADPLTVFKARRPSGELWSKTLAEAGERDWILGRIVWLSGLEPGFNRHGNVDTFARYIYIHGTSPEAALGIQGSKGCIRMDVHDVCALTQHISAGTVVRVADPSHPCGEAPRLSLASWGCGIAPLVREHRETVFGREQGIAKDLMVDDSDPHARHVVLLDADSGEILGSGRITPEGRIGRLAVSRLSRGQGLGTQLLQALLAEARHRLWPCFLHAQTSAASFYEKNGFKAVGVSFMEAGRPHQKMVLV